MYSYKLILAIVVIIFSGMKLEAQDSLAIGSWESHLPFTTSNYVSQKHDKIIYSTKYSIFTIDKEDFSIEFFDKLNLLTDVGIDKHKYDDEGEQLLVLYEDSGIDIIHNDEVIYIPDIKNNSSIIGDKKINNIQINSDRSALLSCGFGLVEFDLEDHEFGFTCFMDMPVYQALHFGKYIIAATLDGLYYFDKEAHNNPADFQLWEHLASENNLPDIYAAVDVIEWKEKLYFASPDRLWKADEELIFELVYETDQDSEIAFINKIYGDLLLGVNWSYDVGRILFFDEEDNFVQSHGLCANKVKYAEFDEQGRIWFADEKGDIRYTNNKIYPCKTIDINSPYSINISDVASKDDRVYVASGGVDPSYTYVWRRDGFFIWDGEKWKNYNEIEFPEFQNRAIYDFFRILPDPIEDKVYIGTYHRGLIVLDETDDSMQFFTQENSTLAGKTGDTSRERISGLALDRDQNLWISNFGAPQPISIFTKNGEWKAFNVDSGKDLRDIVIDHNGYKWVIIDRDAEGLLVFDEGADLNSSADDQQIILSKNNSNLQSNNVNAIEVDRDGDIWIGTDDGPVVFECAASVFTGDCKGIRRITDLEGINAYLLDDVKITCIESDGANRKWFGSENGIFVQSPSGVEEIFHFTKENSPLFDNTIIDLSYNEESGVMYIATAKGLMSYKTMTTGGDDKHQSEVYAYPNPVRPEYTGPIAIKGFARDSNIKITDIQGQLIHEGKALGGQAIWDGYDYSGRRAASGVYLVFATSSETFDEPDTVVTKILVINGE